MNDKLKKILWFLLSFVLSFGTYLGLNIYYGWSQGYLEVSGFFAALISIPICLVAFVIAKGKNISLARGFVWGLVAIFIFLFTIGGCGIVRF